MLFNTSRLCSRVRKPKAILLQDVVRLLGHVAVVRTDEKVIYLLIRSIFFLYFFFDGVCDKTQPFKICIIFMSRTMSRLMERTNVCFPAELYNTYRKHMSDLVRGTKRSFHGVAGVFKYCRVGTASAGPQKAPHSAGRQIRSPSAESYLSL